MGFNSGFKGLTSGMSLSTQGNEICVGSRSSLDAEENTKILALFFDGRVSENFVY